MASSLRRSTKSANPRGLNLTPLTIINDDDAERQASRAQTSDNEITANASILSDREGLADCLKLINANKLTKDNVWSLSLIDNFSRLLNRHHKSVQNFQVAGSTLEASSRIYGIRVDSVHNDVMHMATGLIGMEGPLITGGRVSSNDAQLTTSSPAKRARKKTQISTVTRNKDTINAKLDTICLTEPTFAKLNSVVGDINSSHRLLNYVLPTIRSELIHFSKHPFWDSTEYPTVLLDQNIDYACMPSNAANNTILLSSDLTLRRHAVLQSYRITDIPAVDTEDARELSPIDENYGDDFDADNFEVAFDVNADVEPVPEMIVLNEYPNDMRPLDSLSKTLEYSYRPMENIVQYWAGPSHWKYRRTLNGKTTDENQTIRKMPGRRKKYQPIDVTAPYDESLFISIKSRQAIKLNKRDTQKKWNAKRLKLPFNHNIAPDYFDHYQYAAGLVKWCPSIENDTPPIRQSDDSHNVQADDNHNDDDMSDHLEAGPSQPYQKEALNATVTEIATDFEKAPEKVALIDIPFAKRNKVIDMKQLKRCCWTTIVKQCSDYQRGSASNGVNVHKDSEVTTFKKVCASTPNLLSKSMQEVISPAITFLSILHLASEHSLRLTTDNDVSDFLIIKDKDKAKLALNQH